MDDALAFVRDHSEEPFFLFVPLTIPHASLDVPDDSMEPFLGRFPEHPSEAQGRYIAQPMPHAAFAGMVTRLDADVGRLVSLVDELGLSERTLIIFTSDNGPHLEGGGDPDFFDSNGPLRGYKRDLYEGGIRVPMIARWPGTVAPGSTSEHVSAFWDVLPTLAELAGVRASIETDGLSFLPTLRGEAQPEHESLYWEFHEQGGKQAVRMGDWKGVRLAVEQDPNGPIELYDLSTDLGEIRDVSGDHPDVVNRIAAIMQESHTPSDVFLFPGDAR